MLENLGIYGWKSIEPTILAAMASKMTIMLIGTHGSSKTDGAKALAKAVLGVDGVFQKYDTPTLQAEELLGYPNVKDLAEGRTMRYVSTPLSIWGKGAILLDEINRANMMIQSKVIELAREHTVMGMETGIDYVFAAVNPPSTYGSVYMDLALASRFIMVRVPDLGGLVDAELDNILERGLERRTEWDLGALLESARDAVLPAEDKKQLKELVKKVAKMLHTELSQSPEEPGYNARSMKMLYSLLESSEKLRRLSPDYSKMLGSSTLPDLILSTVPEVWGLVQKKANDKQLRSKIKELLAGFRLGNTITAGADIEELLGVDLEGEDIIAWSVNVTERISQTRNRQKLFHVARTLVPLCKNTLPETVANRLLLSVLSQMYKIGALNTEYPANQEGIVSMIKESFSL